MSSELAGQAWREIEAESAADGDRRAESADPSIDADGDWIDVLELRDSAPWRAWAAARDAAAAAEPDWSVELRGDGRRARDALAAMARDELAFSRAADAVARGEEDLPPRKPAADELERKRAFLDRFAVPPPPPDEDSVAIVPPGVSPSLDVKQALLESLLFSFVVGRAVFDPASLAADEGARGDTF